MDYKASVNLSPIQVKDGMVYWDQQIFPLSRLDEIKFTKELIIENPYFSHLSDEETEQEIRKGFMQQEFLDIIQQVLVFADKWKKDNIVITYKDNDIMKLDYSYK